MTQGEYDYLMNLEKSFEDPLTPINIGPNPIKWTREIVCTQEHESFVLDFYKGSLELSRYTFNKRYRQTLIMLRYDNEGRHTNPDGISFDGRHVHLYREGYNDKFAFPVEEIGIFTDAPVEVVFNKIMSYCKIRRYPSIQFRIF